MRPEKYDWEKVDPFLKENYNKMSATEISKIFSEFTPQQLRDRAKRLGLNKQPKFAWTKELKQYVKDNYATLGARPIADKLNISIHSVNKMAQTLNVKYIPKDEYICVQGYKMVGKSHNRKAEHRLVMERHLGRELSPNEIVHHIDGNKLNNDISNLVITTRSKHIEEHRQDLLKAKASKDIV